MESRKLDRHPNAQTPVFSKDGKKLAFGAQSDRGRELIWNVVDVER